MRAAILQTGGVHEEIVPSLVAALGPGWEVSAWLNDKCRASKGDIFAEVPSPSLTVHYRALDGHPAWETLREDVLAFRPDVVIAATFQREPLAQFIDSLDLPVLGVIHNLRKAAQAPTVAKLIESGRCQPIVLAEHVRAAFNRSSSGAFIDRIGVVDPVNWGLTGAPDPTCRRIAIPGGVNATNRDFGGLLAALGPGGLGRKMAAKGAVIDILGGGPDRARLQREAADSGLSELIRFAPLGASGRVHYSEYLHALRQGWALLPLIPLSKGDYRDFKITSAIPTAIGFGLPMVLDRWTASVYRAPCVTSDISVAAALEALLELSEADHDTLKLATCAYRAAALSRNRAEVARLLPGFGLVAE